MCDILHFKRFLTIPNIDDEGGGGYKQNEILMEGK